MRTPTSTNNQEPVTSTSNQNPYLYPYPPRIPEEVRQIRACGIHDGKHGRKVFNESGQRTKARPGNTTVRNAAREPKKLAGSRTS